MAKQSAYTTLWLAISYGLGNFLYALAYWWGAKQVIDRAYSQTQFFIVLLALLLSAQLWGQMFALAPDVSRAFSSAGKIQAVLELGTMKGISGSAKSMQLGTGDNFDLEAVAEAKEKAPDASGRGASVEFTGVQFSYPSRSSVKVLHGLDLKVEPGQFAALVGPSGAGKSTIISLLERLYLPSAGAIKLDGFDITKSRAVAFRDDIALVPQDNALFEGSIRFNISLGARPGQEATDAEIEEACRLANIHDTIASLPQGCDTHCGPNSNQLSGGQKQRLAIARALVRKPRLLLLDESTSALDAESERLLQEGLEKATQGITVIAIAHRLHTIRKADVIFLIEDGRCVDRGTHAELSERSESYRLNALHQAVDGDNAAR
jgi:ABC-type multidrug transport system fused ATPase/permease subunit